MIAEHLTKISPISLNSSPEDAADGRRLKVAYIMSRFPKLTETFILFEMQALQQQGVAVELYPLLRERTPIMHPEAEAFVQRAHFQPFISWPILGAQLYFLRHKPRRYLSTLWTVLRANWGSLRFFTGTLGIFPKTTYFARQMAADGVTHVHAHFASHPAAAAFIIHRLVGIPYSFTAHGSDLHRDQHMLKEKVAEAAFVTPISNDNRDLILRVCGEKYRDKVRVIHCGVDTRVFHPQVADSSNTHGTTAPFTILCIGTLHEVKGQRYLIEACRLLQQREIDFRCQLVGDGPDREALARQVRAANLGERVHFLGQRTRAEIVALLQQADVLVTPSVPTRIGRREGIPVVLMEAMASGRPVVASDLSGIPELVIHEQTGLLVAARDTASLADALQRLYDDPTLGQRLGRAGRAKVQREFDLQTNAATLARYFTTEAIR